MPRLSEVNDLLFPVKEHSVFVEIPNGKTKQRVDVRDKKAIVNSNNNRVLGIVSRRYRLVTNQQALDWAFECCETVFPETKPVEWQVTAADAPGTGSYCFIDLTHNSSTLDFSCVSAGNRPDAFGPFIRVLNSYNRQRALAFDIGFYRKVCTNGMIAPDSIIRFRFSHLRRDIGEGIEFEVARDKLSKYKVSFSGYLDALQKCDVPREKFDAISRSVLSISEPADLEPESREAAEWDALSTHMGKLCEEYAQELGENAYAVFNAITDFASHPLTNRFVTRTRHSLQRLAGSWIDSFSKECQKPGFKVDEYLTKTEQPGAIAS